jgi:hypothetical protein
MIVKDHEKKARGFISVTQITARAHVSALPSPYSVCRDRIRRWSTVSRGWPAMPKARVPLAAGTEDAAAVTVGQ